MLLPDFIDTSVTDVLVDIPDPVAVISKDYHILWANNAILKYLNAGNDEIHGRLCFEAILSKTRKCPNCPVRTVFDSGRSSVTEKCLAGSDGSVVWGEVRAYPVRDGAGAVVAVIWIGFDITAKKRAHALQTKQLESLETALRTLSKPEATASESGPESGEVYMLTPREIGVLRLLANGRTNREIAGILCISHHTVKSHVAHVFDKLGVTHRAEAAVKAARLRLI